MVEKRMDERRCSTIMHNGKIVYYKAAGYNDLNSKAPLQKDAIILKPKPLPVWPL